MKKALLILAFAATATGLACSFEILPGSVQYSGAVFPFISHVNGREVASAVPGRDTGVCYATFTLSPVSTNMPLTVRVSTVRLGDGGGRYCGVLLFHPLTTGGWEYTPAVCMDLEYSGDDGATWTRIARRRFINVGQNSLAGTTFGRDLLPLSFASGTVLRLRLITYINGTGVNESRFRHNRLSSNGGVIVSLNGIQTLSADDCGFVFEVSVTISGNRRGGR